VKLLLDRWLEYSLDI